MGPHDSRCGRNYAILQGIDLLFPVEIYGNRRPLPPESPLEPRQRNEVWSSV